MQKEQPGAQSKIVWALALIPGVFWVFHALGLNMWWDEVSSLRGFILVEPSHTVTNYQEANNHVFFNLIANLLTSLFGQRDFLWHLQHPYVLRLPFVLVGVATSWYIVKFAKRFLHVESTPLVLMILFTTMPFLNYALQLRGYGLSMFFSILLLYNVYAFIEKRGWLNTVLIIVSSFGLLYTIPSNVYLFFGIGVVMLKQLFFPKSNWPKSFVAFIKSPQVMVVVLITVGVGLTILAYYPILDNILNNRTVAKTPADRAYVLVKIMPAVFWAIISWRILVFVPIFKNIKNLKIFPNELLLLPVSVFLFSFAMNHMPFERTFANLIPVFVLYLAAIGAEQLKAAKNKQRTALGIAGYLLITFFGMFYVFQFQFKKDLKESKKEQGMLKNYATATQFKFNDESEEIAKRIPAGAIVLLTQEEDRPGIMYSLHGHGVYPYALNKIAKDPAQSNKQQTAYKINIHEGNRPEDKTPYELYTIPLQGQSDFKKSNFTPLFKLLEQVAPSKDYYFVVNYAKAFEKEYSFYLARNYKIEKVYNGDYLQAYRVYR